MIRKLKSGAYRALFPQEKSPHRTPAQSRDVSNKRAAEKHEREVQYFKRH